MIWAACKNPGGLNNVLPVVNELRKRSHDVVIVTNGGAVAEMLVSRGESFLFANSTDEVTKALDLIPNLLFTSMCDGGIGIDLLQDCGYKTVAVQDFWGGWIKDPAWSNAEIHPDHICVNDDLDGDLIKKEWREFFYEPNRIVVTGYPAFDKYAAFDAKATKDKVVSGLGLDPKKPIVMFAGQLWYTEHALRELVEALNRLKLDIYFVPRFHPRMAKEMPEDFAKCLDLLTSFTGGVLIRDTSEFDSPTILGAADVATGMFTTMLIEAAILRKPNISILYPDAGMKQFLQECPGLDEFPLVSMGCSYKATMRDEMEWSIKRALAMPDDLRERQEGNFKLDGQNTKRVADFVESLL